MSSKRIPLVLAAATVCAGVLFAVVSATPASAGHGIVKTVSCPGTTGVGLYQIVCGGSGAQGVTATVVTHPVSDGAAKGQAADLTFRPTGSTSGGTVAGVDVSESLCTTAQGTITWAAAGTTGLVVTVVVTRTDGGSISDVAGGQSSSTEALMAVKGQGADTRGPSKSKC